MDNSDPELMRLLRASIDLEQSRRLHLVRPTLNGLTPRTLRDAERDPFDHGLPPRLPRERYARVRWAFGLGMVAIGATFIGVGLFILVYLITR